MKIIGLLIMAVAGFFGLVAWLGLSAEAGFILGLTLLMSLQGFFASRAMLFSFMNEKSLAAVEPAEVGFSPSKLSFSLIVPARGEAAVIAETLRAFSKINYPSGLYEVLVLVRADDGSTIRAVKQAILQSARKNIKLVRFYDRPINKAHALNVALRFAKNQVVAVFDAEDEPAADILKTVAATFREKEVDVVQAGVQLVNVADRWFSAINCLEYYFWFKSVLPFFSTLGSTPLGGNTFFIKREYLDKVAGWDEHCLTEDIDLGLRLSLAGAKTQMIYGPRLATLEETPLTEAGFIRQRSRWDQGYLQVLFKGDWLKLAKLGQQWVVFYLLIQPLVRHILTLAMVFLPVLVTLMEVPLWLSLASWLPAYFLWLQIGLYVLGMIQLRRYYQLVFSPLLYLFIIMVYLPYQLLLLVASGRALLRLAWGEMAWEKTDHYNRHRLVVK